MYYEVVNHAVKILKQVETWLDKAELHAKEKGFDVNVLMSSRLAPDQYHFIQQVQIACDCVKAASAWLTGQPVPKHPDDEKTIEEIRARLKKAIAFSESMKERDFSGASERQITFTWQPGKVMFGTDYLLEMVIPNTYFHLSHAYAILRHNGVNLGKKDFLGQLTFKDA